MGKTYLFPMPYALCPMPYALFPMPYSPFPLLGGLTAAFGENTLQGLKRKRTENERPLSWRLSPWSSIGFRGIPQSKEAEK